MKKIILFVFIVGLVFYAVYDRSLNTEAQRCQKNHTNAVLIKNGMSEDEVLRIMGKPDTVKTNMDFEKIYHYASDNVDYLDIEICFNSKEVVQKFIPPLSVGCEK